MPAPEKTSALQKACAALETIAAAPHPLGLSEIAARIGLSRQAAHRVLRQLEDQSLVRREPIREGYLVGARLIRLSLTALASAHRLGAAHLVLEGLAARVGETCNVGLLDGREAVYIDRVECDWPLRLQLQTGQPGAVALLGHRQTALGLCSGSGAPTHPRRRGLAALHRVHHYRCSDPGGPAKGDPRRRRVHQQSGIRARHSRYRRADPRWR